jgi:hypothetical protein
MSLGAPPGFQVFPHIEFAGHRFSLDFPRERERKGVSDCAFRQPAQQPNHIAVNHAAKIARNEFAAMDPLDAAPLLVEREGVEADACSKFNLNIPNAAQVSDWGLRRFLALQIGRRGKDSIKAVRDHFFISWLQVESRDRDAILRASRSSYQDSRVGCVEDLR